MRIMANHSYWFMPSLCVFESEAVGYGVRGGPAHGVLAADHVRPADPAPVARGEPDRGAAGVGDQECRRAGPAGERPRGQRVGEVRAGGVHGAVHAQAVPGRPPGDPLARLVAGRAGQARQLCACYGLGLRCHLFGHGVDAADHNDSGEPPGRECGLLAVGQTV